MLLLSDVQRALALRATFPAAHPLEMLDLVFDARVLTAEECSALEPHGALPPEALAFVAAAFDKGMTEAEWLGWQSPPAHLQLQTAVRSLWIDLIVPAFRARYSGLTRPFPLVGDRPATRMFRAL